MKKLTSIAVGIALSIAIVFSIVRVAYAQPKQDQPRFVLSILKENEDFLDPHAINQFQYYLLRDVRSGREYLILKDIRLKRADSVIPLDK